ncbi:unnamed protein product [Symbiodinium sp. CCMP2592]|nr:unnamed protein product [Symbiodinium sp. CCMP2592]
MWVDSALCTFATLHALYQGSISQVSVVDCPNLATFSCQHGQCPARVHSCSSKCELDLMVGIIVAKVGPLSPHSRSCLVLSGVPHKFGMGVENSSGCNARVISQAWLGPPEVDAAIAASTPAKFMVMARPVLLNPGIFRLMGPGQCSCTPRQDRFWRRTPSEASSRRTPLCAVRWPCIGLSS